MKTWQKYYKSFTLSIQSAMEYRIDFFLNILSGISIIIVQSFLWTAIFENTNQETIYSYTYAQMLSYTIMAGIVSKLVSAGFERQIAVDIKNGGLSKFLVQPISYVYYRIFVFLGRKFYQGGFILLACLLVFFFGNVFFKFGLNVQNILVVIIPMILSIVLNFFIYYCLSSITFWMTEVSVLYFGINVITAVLSGAYFPLDIFGNTFLKVLSCLPFKYTIYFPLNILVGKIESRGILLGIMIQMLWIIALSLLSKFIWKAGMKKYISVGG
ncbi:MAG: ABC-2 family transporter protein [Lutisporaceae bacterium]